MCGIAGFISNGRASLKTGIDGVQLMSEAMRRRGPDAHGLWNDEMAVLGHRRLAILDLDRRSDQPMLSHDGRFVITFNGEIYNFRELRCDLERKGISFRTASDTEVLLALFAVYGQNMLSHLRGMFAFGIWDTWKRELFLARDAYGIKPLYYACTEVGFLFASQVKAIRHCGLISPSHEPAGVAGFFLWGSVPEPWTIFRNIFAVPAGHYVRLGPESDSEPRCWNDICSHWRNANHQHDLIVETVRQSVTDSIRAHLVADVPISVFLSGGVDSASVAAVAVNLGIDIEGVTIVFDEFADRRQDEGPTASTIASDLGIRHYLRKVSRAEFEADLPRILEAMDQPTVDGINTWFASKAAAERGYKIALSGIGGDELFCGYSHFKHIPRTRSIRKLLARLPLCNIALEAVCTPLARLSSKPKLMALPQHWRSVEALYLLCRALFLPHELPTVIDPDIAKQGLARLHLPTNTSSARENGDDSIQLSQLESTRYLRNQLLRDSDWASMAHSLELRTPLVDAMLLKALGPFSAGFVKGVGKTILASFPRTHSLSIAAKRPKTGFSVPMGSWIQESQFGSTRTCKIRPRVPGCWARTWAQIVMERSVPCA